MEKREVFTFKAPNGAEVQAVVIHKMQCTGSLVTDTYICYGQNRIFTYIENLGVYMYGKTLTDFAVIPEYDTLLANYKQ